MTGLTPYPVSGKVTFRGKPIVDATVVLHPVTKPSEEDNFFLPRGNVLSDGSFRLTTYNSHDGAPAGDYKVTFDWTGSHEGLDEDEIDARKQILPRKYTSPDTSEFVVTISEGANKLDTFKLR